MSDVDGKLIDTKKYTEDRGVVQIDIIETTYELPNGDRKIKKHKTYHGPRGAVNRAMNWKHFGGVTPKNSMNCTTIGEDTFFEPTIPAKKYTDEWIPNGLYLREARKFGFSDNQIKEIIRSDRPDLVYYRLFSQFVQTKFGIKLPPNTGGSNIGPSKGSAATQDISENGTATQPKAKMGIRARFKQQKAELQNEPVKEQSSFKSRFNKTLKESRKEDDEKLCTIFVCNVPTYYNEQDIKSLFDDTDFTIRRVNMVRHESYPGGPREPNGNAFVVCSTVDETQQCIEMLNGAKWDSSVMSAQLAKPKK